MLMKTTGHGKGREVEVVHDHSLDDPPFNAVTVKTVRGEQWVVRPEELFSFIPPEVLKDPKR